MSQNLSNSNLKRRLDCAFDDPPGSSSGENSSDPFETSESKRLNVSDSDSRRAITKFESHMFEAEMKSSIIKIATLEQELKSEQNERKKIEIEFNLFKEKQTAEFRELQEQKRQLEVSLKNCKMNNELMNSEMEHLRTEMLNLEKVKVGDKDKELGSLREKIKELTEEKKTLTSKHAKELSDTKYNLEAKMLEVGELEAKINCLNETIKSSSDLNTKIEQFRKENCLLNNKIRDLEMENTKLNENTQHSANFMEQSDKIENLERENRKLKSEIEYLNAIREKTHIYEEELRSKSNQIERYQKKIVNLELENNKLMTEIGELKLNSEQKSSSAIADQLKNVISDLDAEVLKLREKNTSLSDDIKRFKSELKEKDDSIDSLQKRVTRLNAERNGYQNIINIYDLEKNSASADAQTKVLFKRIEELEMIINEYKKSIGETHELKLCNNSSFHLEDNANVKSIGVQVNLNKEIYSNYEAKIEMLNKQLKDAHDKMNDKDSTDLLDLTSKWSYENAKLQERINMMEEQHSFSASQENSGNYPSVDFKAYQTLELKLKDQVVLSQRQLTEFERRSLEIMRTIRSLLGFKVNFLEKSIKLTCIQDKDLYLTFRINKDFSLSLLESELAKRYTSFIDTYLKQYNSIIVFLTAISLDLVGHKMEITSNQNRLN